MATPKFIQDELDALDIFEGCFVHVYLDSDGPPNVTTGRGYLIADLAAMLALPWHESSGVLATSASVVQEWNTIKAAPPGYKASYYAGITKLHLESPDIDALTMASLADCVADLPTMYSGFDGFPDTAKTGLLDMRYNLGRTKLANTYPNFNSGVRAARWDIAAAECGRNITQPAFAKRNAWTRGLFLAAEEKTA